MFVWAAARGWTLRQLARAMHVSHAYLSLIQHGKRRPGPTFWRGVAHLAKQEFP